MMGYVRTVIRAVIGTVSISGKVWLRKIIENIFDDLCFRCIDSTSTIKLTQ